MPYQAATPVEAAKEEKEHISLQEAVKRYVAVETAKGWPTHTAKNGKTRYKFRGLPLACDSTCWENGLENTRWTEETLYVTDDGKIVVASEHITRWQGESDTYTVKVITSLNDVTSQALLDDLRENLCIKLNVKISVAEVARPLSELEASL